MANRNALAGWRVFLRGRIAHEQNKIEEALMAYELALNFDPDNIHFLKAKTLALSSLNEPGEGAVSAIEKGYLELTQSCGGEKDRPEPWIKGMEELMQMAEGIDRHKIHAVW